MSIVIRVWLPRDMPTPEDFRAMDEELAKAGFTVSALVGVGGKGMPWRVTHPSRRGRVPGATEYMLKYEMPPLLIGRLEYYQMSLGRTLVVEASASSASVIAKSEGHLASESGHSCHLEIRSFISSLPLLGLSDYDADTCGPRSVEALTAVVTFGRLQCAFLALHRRWGAVETLCEDSDYDKPPFHFKRDEVVRYLPVPEEPVFLLPEICDPDLVYGEVEEDEEE